MSLRRCVEEAFLAQFIDNEKLLSAARSGDPDPYVVEKYEALQIILKPIVTDIVFERERPVEENAGT
jgi:hypothetical protein